MEASTTSSTRPTDTALHNFSDVSQLSFTRKGLNHMTRRSEENETKKFKHTSRRPWLCGPLPLPRQGCRFELAMDIKLLENMTVVNYLTLFCIVSKRRRYLFKTIFTKADRDRDGLINSFELQQAILDLYSKSIGKDDLDDILNIIDCQVGSVFDWKQFAAIAAFSERYLCICYQQDGELNVRKQLLEQTDFGGIKAKLEGYCISPKLSKILLLL